MGHYIRWMLRVMQDDGGGEGAAAERLAGMPWRVLRWIVSNGQLLGLGLEGDTDLALDGLRAAAQPLAERESSLRAEIYYLHNAGRPAEAQDAIDDVRPAARDRLRIYFALYGDGAMEPATAAAKTLATRVDGEQASPSPDGGDWILDLCALEQWRLSQSRYDRTEETVRRLRAAGAPVPSLDLLHARACASLLEALVAEALERSDLPALVDRLEAEHDANLPHFAWDQVYSAIPLVLARMREAQGDIEGALAASRRRPTGGGTQNLFLSTFLQKEGRLAGLAGDRDAAIRAYHHYLALRPRAEPALAPGVDRVREELASLLPDRR
jgi:hypothetical protein